MAEELQGPEVWPFVLGRGRVTGYRLLAIPGFMDEAEDGGLFAQLDTATLTEEPKTANLTWRGRRYTFAYRCSPLHAHDANGVSTDDQRAEEVLKDEHGRPITVIHGYLAEGLMVDVAHPEDLENTLGQAVAVYRDLLQDEPAFVAQQTSPFPGRSTFSPVVVAETSPVEQRPDDRHRSAPAPRISSCLFVVIGALAVVVVIASLTVATVISRCCRDSVSVAVNGPILVATADLADEASPVETADLTIRFTDDPLCLYANRESDGKDIPIIWPPESVWQPDERQVRVTGVGGYTIDDISDLPMSTIDIDAVEDSGDETLDGHLTNCLDDRGDEALVVTIGR